MKKVFALSLITCVAVLLVGCTTREIVYMPPTTVDTTAVETTQAPTTTIRKTPATTQPVYSNEDLYLLTLKSSDPYYYGLVTEDFLIEYGYLICEYFENGGQNSELLIIIIETVRDAGLPEDYAYFLGGASGAAVAAFCPEYEYKLT